jgi:hypothetical protein
MPDRPGADRGCSPSIGPGQTPACKLPEPADGILAVMRNYGSRSLESA